MQVKQKNFIKFPQYSIKDWKLWFKILFVLITGFVIFYSYISRIVMYTGYVNQINDLLSANASIQSLDQLINKGLELNAKWVTTTIVDGVSTSRVIAGVTFASSNNQLLAYYQIFENIIYQTTFFTVISNWLIFIWMLISLIAPTREGAKGLLAKKTTLVIAAYITVTLLIYNFALRLLVPTRWIGDVSFIENLINLASNEILHLVGPIVYVAYICLGVRYDSEEKFSIKDKNLHKIWILGVIGLLIYGFSAIIFGLLRQSAGYSISSSFPYFFLEITNPSGLAGLPGVIWFIIFIPIIAGICIGFETLYDFIISKMHDIRINKK